MSSIQNQYTDEITCPWCGYKYEDSWEYEDDQDEMECSDCGKKFSMSKRIEVDYSTYRDEDECPHEGVDIHYNDRLKEWIFSCDSCGKFDTTKTKEDAEAMKR